MQIWKCPAEGCDYTVAFGIAVGGLPHCERHPEVEVVTASQEMSRPDVIVGGDVAVAGQVNIGGNLHNSAGGKVTVSPTGQLNVVNNALNEGDIQIGSDQWKTVLLECVKTAGNIAEFGSKVLSTFFRVS